MLDRIRERDVKAATNWINVRYPNRVEGSVKLVEVLEEERYFEKEIKLEMAFKVAIGDYIDKGVRKRVVRQYNMVFYMDKQGKVARFDRPIIGAEELL